MTAKKVQSNDFWSWVRANLLALLGICAAVIGFGYTQIRTIDAIKAVVDRHDGQFKEVNLTFEKFNNTLKQNYDDYAKNQKEEALTREKTRDQLLSLFNKLSENSATTNIKAETTNVKVEAISKALDGVVNKLDTIQTNQRLPQASRK